MTDARSRRWLITLVAVLTALAATLSLAQAPIPAQASGGALSSLTLTNANITLNPQPTPFLFHGTASAKDDTTNVVATFTSGTATYAVNGVSQGSLTSGAGSPATLNTGVTEITVTHTATDSTVTTYTIKIVRSFPITSMTVIDADDSTVLYDYPAPFNVNTVIPPITVGHNVDRIRYRMTYADPTGAPGVTGYQTWIDNAGFCPSGTCASGEWSPPFTLAVGSNTWGPLTYVTTPAGDARTTWFTPITRQPAFTSSTLTNLQLTNPSITLNAQPTPFLFYGTASAKDDTTHVVATFTSGTATYAVNGVNRGSLTSGAGSPASLNTGITEITVTHTATDSTVTTYTIKIVRSFPITSFTVIDADDSTVLYDYPAPFNVNTVIPPLTVGHNVDRIRYRMTYANPTGTFGVTGIQTWIDNAGGCSGTCLSGEWTPPFTLAVGPNTWGPITQVTTDIGNNHTAWNATITRQPAFTSSTLSNLQLANPSITLNAQPTPFLFYGTASAKDDTTHVVATFTSGTATYAVNGVSRGSLTSGAGSPATLNTGVTEITVTHTATDSTVTTYTIKIVRSFPITSMTVIDADDSTVLYDYPAPFNVNTVIPPITVGHNVDRIRYRMTYANPTGTFGVTSIQTWIDNAGFCSGPCASGEWTPPFTLAVGPNTWGPITQVTTDIDSPSTRWNATITRATAFAAIGSITVPPSGNAIPAGTQVTVTPGSVTGNPPPVVTYTWEAAPTANDPFEPVATTVNPVWTPDNTVADQLLRVVATADNGFSTPTSITSTTFGPISGVNEAPDVDTVTISGSAVEGQVLTASARVLGYPRPAVTYQWLRATDDTATFSTIFGATGSTYTLTASDVAHVVRVQVTAGANTQGPASQDQSASTARVAAGSSPSPSPSPSSSPSPSPSPGGGDGADPARPGNPTSVTATIVGSTLLVAWQPPADAAASTISHYDVLLQPSMKRCLTSSLTCVLDVKPGHTYTVSVRALNAGGWGGWSNLTVTVPPAPRFAFTAVIEKGRLVLTGTSTHVPEGARLNVRITRGSGDGPQVKSGPLVTSMGRFTWSRKVRGNGPLTVKVGYNSTWSGAVTAGRS